MLFSIFFGRYLLILSNVYVVCIHLCLLLCVSVCVHACVPAGVHASEGLRLLLGIVRDHCHLFL